MTEKTPPIATVAADVPARLKPSRYPEPFASQMRGREKRQLGENFGLTYFGVNLVRMYPGSRSALRHAHSKQDEFIYIVQGEPTLHTDEGRTELAPGMCAGFRAGTGNGHCLENNGDSEVVYHEIGDRSADDEVSYPDADLRGIFVDGQWQFVHKDGSSY